MFRGNHPTRVDEKGRLKMPVDHKRTVDEKYSGSTSFYITSSDGERAEIYPMQQWLLIEQAVLRKTGAAKQKWLDVTGYYGQEIEMDAQGRLLIPQQLREDAGLVGDVAVVGQLTKLVVTNASRYKARLTAAPLTDADRDALALEDV